MEARRNWEKSEPHSLPLLPYFESNTDIAIGETQKQFSLSTIN